MDNAPPSTLDKWSRWCEAKGFQPVGKAELPTANVYVAERQQPGIVLSIDPIECQTHWVIAWALEQKVNDGPQMTFGRTVKLRAIEVPFQKQRIQAALHDAAQHVRAH